MANKSTLINPLQLLYWLTLVIFIILINQNIRDYGSLIPTFLNADWLLLTTSLLLNTGNLLIYALILESNYRVVSKRKTFPNYLKESIISYFISMTTPFGTAGSNAYLVNYLKGLGLSYLKSIFALASANLSKISVFSLLLLVGLRYLHTHHVLTPQQVAASSILVLVAIVTPFVILTVMLAPQFSTKFAGRIVDFVNWFAIKFARKDIIDNRKFEKYRSEVISMSTDFNHSMFKFLGTLKFSFANHIIALIALYLTFLAYDVNISVTILIVIYSIVTLFTSVAPTPQGIGVAEGLTQLAAVSVGLPGSGAFATIMTYRLFTVWVPALLGFIALRRKVRKTSSEPLEEKTS